jgi:hypothetical protein
MKDMIVIGGFTDMICNNSMSADVTAVDESELCVLSLDCPGICVSYRVEASLALEPS